MQFKPTLFKGKRCIHSLLVRSSGDEYSFCLLNWLRSRPLIKSIIGALGKLVCAFLMGVHIDTFEKTAQKLLTFNPKIPLLEL